jgi:plasmid maintenance system antidote protein VapI
MFNYLTKLGAKTEHHRGLIKKTQVNWCAHHFRTKELIIEYCFRRLKKLESVPRKNKKGNEMISEKEQYEAMVAKKGHFYLKREFQWRKEKNPLYSQRAFARDLGLSSGEMSELLAGKRSLTLKKRLRLLDHIELSEQEKKEFLSEVQRERMVYSQSNSSTAQSSFDLGNECVKAFFDPNSRPRYLNGVKP